MLLLIFNSIFIQLKSANSFLIKLLKYFYLIFLIIKTDFFENYLYFIFQFHFYKIYIKIEKIYILTIFN